MTYRYLTDLASVIRKTGLRVVEMDGWKGRGRPSTTGDFNPRGVLWHHTGGPADGHQYATWLALTGRSDLPAPLCQVSIGRDGTVYVLAAGRANHAGKAQASGPMPPGDGNALYLGVECMNTGTEGWAPQQYEAMVKVGAALASHYGWTADHNRGHKETSITGKWDPGMLDLNEFRDDIREAMTSRPRLDRKLRKRLSRAITTAKKAERHGMVARLRKMRARLPK